MTPGQEPQKSAYAAINGMQMYYELYGEGDPLLMVHGYFKSRLMWRTHIPVFSPHYHLIIPDLRGHGKTNNPLSTFTHRQAAKDTLALLDLLGIGSVRAVGTSTGGMVLTHMATMEPSRFEALILIGSTIYFPEEARAIMRQHTDDTLNEKKREDLTYYNNLGKEQIEALWRQFYQFKDSYDDTNFTPPYLATITARTLIIHGDRDGFFPINIPIEMYRSIPRSYHWILTNRGHPGILHHQEYFGKVALDFLAGRWEAV
jgi:pimeloyl-ACP methyl ester carboxylesterase